MSDDLHQTSSGKRLDVISWDEFFMSVAIAAQRRSKDPNTQEWLRASPAPTTVSFGGLQRYALGAQRRLFPWGTSDDPLQDKHNYVSMPRPTPCSTTVARSRTSRFHGLRHAVPVPRLRQDFAQVGVGEVVYLDNKYADTDDGRISRRILDSCGISYRPGYRRCSHRYRGAGSAVARDNASW